MEPEPEPEPDVGDVLQAIDRRLTIIRRDAETLTGQFRRAREALTAIEQKQVASLERLARLRMADIASGELVDSLGEVDRRVGEILAIRAAAKDALREKLAASERELDAARSARAQQEPVVAAAAQAARSAAERREALLAANDAYAAVLAAAQAAQATAQEAGAKAALAESDRREKTRPYDADPVFAYLWGRRFGTRDYVAGSVIRALDGWVARRNDYEALRRDYWLLQELPRRLTDHAQHMREKADASLAAARALEAEAARAAGIDAAQRALEEAQERLADVDRAIEAHAAMLESQARERERFAAGEDEHAARCADLLAAALQRADVHELRKRAVRTSTDEDDRLVDEVEALEQERARQQDELIRVRRLQQAERERTLGLEEVRRRLEASGGGRAPVTDGRIVDTLLDRFVAGSLSVDGLAEGLRRQLLNFDARFAGRSPK